MMLLSGPLVAEVQVEGVVLGIGARQLTLRTSSGGKMAAFIRPDARLERRSRPAPLSHFQKGDFVILVGGGSPFSASRVTEQSAPASPGRYFGRIAAVDASRKEIRLDTESGPKVVRIDPGTAVFKENRLTSWLDLHQGQAVAVHAADAVARAIFDPSSYVVREYQPDYGPLLAWGEVVQVREGSSGLEGGLEVRNLTGEVVSLSWDRSTRWRLGARFKSPRDFEGVESLVFGTSKRARAVVSTRAIPYLFDLLSRP